MIGAFDFYGRPENRWEYELRKLSKAALLHLVDNMLFIHRLLDWFDEAKMLERIRHAKKLGRSDNACSSYDRWKADPEAAYRAQRRRQGRFPQQSQP